MKTVTIDKKTINALFEQSERQADYIIGLYKLVYDNWDDIQTVNGFPKVSDDTNKYISTKAIAFDQAYHPNVLAGGGWMNNGFSSEKGMSDWEVLPAPVTLKE